MLCSIFITSTLQDLLADKVDILKSLFPFFSYIERVGYDFIG